MGCGTGHFTRWFAAKGLEAVGIDPSRPMLEAARRAGGAGGGGSGLSPQGRRLLELFERLNRDVAAHADALFARYMREGADEATGTDDTA